MCSTVNLLRNPLFIKYLKTHSSLCEASFTAECMAYAKPACGMGGILAFPAQAWQDLQSMGSDL